MYFYEPCKKIMGRKCLTIVFFEIFFLALLSDLLNSVVRNFTRSEMNTDRDGTALAASAPCRKHRAATVPLHIASHGLTFWDSVYMYVPLVCGQKGKGRLAIIRS